MVATQNVKKYQWQTVYANDDTKCCNRVLLLCCLDYNGAGKVKFKVVEHQVADHRVVENFGLELLDAHLPLLRQFNASEHK